jgi:hypothetical protein
MVSKWHTFPTRFQNKINATYQLAFFCPIQLSQFYFSITKAKTLILFYWPPYMQRRFSFILNYGNPIISSDYLFCAPHPLLQIRKKFSPYTEAVFKEKHGVWDLML